MKNFKRWDRAIVLIDMNAFFASVEQYDNPSLRAKPVAITNGEQGSCIITCSYEARAFGVKTGMRLREAYHRCPGLIRCPSHPKRYAEISTHIMAALTNLVPDIEIFSIDEAFLDVTHYQSLYGHPEVIGRMLKQTVFDVSQLHSSVGVSGDKTTAKFAAKLYKPNGFCVIPPWEAKQRLSQVPVDELCGIGPGIKTFLARYGVHVCGDMEKLPISILGKRYGNLGRRIWHMCQGSDPEPMRIENAAPKSMGHGKILPPNTKQQDVILTYLMHMSEKLGARLRRNELEAQLFFIGLRTYAGWLESKNKFVMPTNDGKIIFQHCTQLVEARWHNEVVKQVQVTALDPKPVNQQQDFLMTYNSRRYAINHATDAINHRYGEFTLAPARLLERSQMHNVIAPSWQPDGHRKTV